MIKRFFKNLLISTVGFIIVGVVFLLELYALMQCVWGGNWWWSILPIVTIIVYVAIEETSNETPA